MKCIICKNGETKPGKVTVTLEREHTIIIIKDVPAQICNNCAEYYLSDKVTERVLEMAERSIQNL